MQIIFSTDLPVSSMGEYLCHTQLSINLSLVESFNFLMTFAFIAVLLNQHGPAEVFLIMNYNDTIFGRHSKVDLLVYWLSACGEIKSKVSIVLACDSHTKKPQQ